MRRKDKQMIDKDALDMLMQSKVISMAINTGDYPYIVPLNYACDVDGDDIALYIHCAKEGRKIDLLRVNPKIGFETHNTSGFSNDKNASECTTLYGSIIGTGVVSFVEKKDEKVRALSLLMKALVNREVSEFEDRVVDKTTILKITVKGFDGKKSSN